MCISNLKYFLNYFFYNKLAFSCMPRVFGKSIKIFVVLNHLICWIFVIILCKIIVFKNKIYRNVCSIWKYVVNNYKFPFLNGDKTLMKHSKQISVCVCVFLVSSSMCYIFISCLCSFYSILNEMTMYFFIFFWTT